MINRTIPVPPPTGLKWHLDARFWGETAATLQLLPENTILDNIGRAYPAKDGKRIKNAARAYPLGQAYIERPTQIRSRSKRIIRDYYRGLIADAAREKTINALAASIQETTR